MKNLQLKKLAASTVVAVAMVTALTPAAQALTVGPTGFNVTVTLTPVCTMAAFSPAALAFGSYTAFGGAVAATPTSAILTCTRGLTGVSAAFDTGVDKTSSAIQTSPTGEGVVAGLNYTMTATRSTPATALGLEATAGAPGSIGTPAQWTYTISGNMPANQAGTCVAGPSCAGLQVRTLTVTY